MATYTDDQFGIIFVVNSAAIFAAQRLQAAEFLIDLSPILPKFVCSVIKGREVFMSGHVQMSYNDLSEQCRGESLVVWFKSLVLSRFHHDRIGLKVSAGLHLKNARFGIAIVARQTSPGLEKIAPIGVRVNGP